MESSRFRVVIPNPCLTCNATELRVLHERYKASSDDHWIYRICAYNQCNRCVGEDRGSAKDRNSITRKLFPKVAHYCCPIIESVQVPIPCATVGLVERAIHASSVAEKGTPFRSHGTFIHHLSNLKCDELFKQSLCAWAPPAMMSFNLQVAGSSRRMAVGQPSKGSRPEQTGSNKPVVDAPSEQITHKGNPDVEDGRMLGTQLNGDEYGEETRIVNQEGQVVCGPVESKVLATQIGPDLIPTEVFQSTVRNLQAGLAKRVKPLPFKAGKPLIRRIEKTVTALIKNVFPSEKIIEWRQDNPLMEEMKSKKWSPERFRNAFNECMCDISARIEQEFQIKVNEALPSKGKAPRPIIQTGDKGQIFMTLPVKCFEELLFDFFEAASIKHVDKHAAMQRVAEHLRQKDANLVEGDGSAWDACCNPTIRKMTENRIIEHIIEVLGSDPECPYGWMKECLRDMKKEQIKGKAKVDDSKAFAPFRVCIDAIRQSGHRGTSSFNWLINLVGWLCVLCEKPEQMIRKSRGKLEMKYISISDGEEYLLKYAFEGDDSAISTTEKLDRELVERLWTSMGFRMKLVYVEDKMTFTGFDFLCDKQGPVGVQIPEIPRNIASSSWSCSSELKSKPWNVHVVGAAAMLARAENFKDCGPLSRYFASLGLAHMKEAQDFEIGEDQAIGLGIQPVDSVVARLHHLAEDAGVMDCEVRKLVQAACGTGFTLEQEANLLSCEFDSPDAIEARYLIPEQLWGPDLFEQARR